MKLKILHIAVHLGGGIGTVLRNWIKSDVCNEHTILLLNRNFYGESQDNIHENMRHKYDEINHWINSSDIVIVHFWNHPLLFEFLINAHFPACRLCIWSHVSGLYPPYVHSDKLVQFPDRFILSSPISYQTIQGDVDHVSVIWTTRGVEDFVLTERKLTEHEFKIGYIGTLDYSKIHPQFVDLCSAIHDQIPSAKFIVCGDGCDKGNITQDVESRGLSTSFEFTGYVNNIQEILSTFNVFGYPLNERHFGTCEQVLGEAMACGVESITLDNPAEKYIIERCGGKVSTIKDYTDRIISIYQNPTALQTSESLRECAASLYSMKSLIESWGNLFTGLLSENKKDRSWGLKAELSGHRIFIESLGKYGDVLKYGSNEEIKTMFDSNHQWRSKNKGSVYQYLDAFPNDPKLLEWSKL